MRLDQPATKSPKQGNTVFWKFWQFLQKQYTFQKQLKTLKKILLCLINKDWVCENTFNQVQSHKWIWYSLNIDMCDVCEYQQWDSPKSNVKLQWSIQPSHTQIALGKLTYLNYRNMHIWPPTKLDYIRCEAFHLAPYTSYHLIFLNQYISLWDWFLKFFIFQFDELAFGFLGIIHFILRRFPFFLVKY